MEILSGIFVRILADGLIVAIVVIGGYALLMQPRKQWYSIVTHGIVAGLLALALGKIAGQFYNSQRPFAVFNLEPGALYLDNPGFPSDHILFAAMITLVVWVTTRNRRLAMVLLTMTLLVGLGRVLALVHSPIDIVGGMFMVLIAGLIVYGVKVIPTRWQQKLG